ncbi:MAG: metallophosphoesterase [Sedimenticola sp.]
MGKQEKNQPLHRYWGADRIAVNLPTDEEPWLQGKKHALHKRSCSHARGSRELVELLERYPLRWPSHPVYFFSDPHADTDAMLASLVASGGVKKTGRADHAFRLTKAGRNAHFIIGGDCFDKGPGNLRLLRTLKQLKNQEVNLRILAGNHDMRTLLGMQVVGGKRNLRNEHFFVRMGVKVVPLLKEINEEFLQGRHALKQIPGVKECRRQLYPSSRWFQEFPKLADAVMSPSGVEREMKRFRVKAENFEGQCEVAELSLRQVYAAALKWRELFLKPKGEFAWFFQSLRLVQRKGSFLYVHAGLDDHIADVISKRGVGHLNRQFRERLFAGDPFEFYYGRVANTIRTKYRAVDRPFSFRGARAAHNSGIHAIVHGHRNLYHGQRISLRKEMVHFECDTTMDRNSRKKEGLQGIGAGVTVFRPEGVILGISNDYPSIKIFSPESLLLE